MLNRFQRAPVLYLHSTYMPLITTQHIRLILSSYSFALDLIEFLGNCFKSFFFFFPFFQLGCNHYWVDNELGKKVTKKEKEKYWATIWPYDRATACTYLYCTMAMSALTEQELSYFSIRWMLLCISIFPQVPYMLWFHIFPGMTCNTYYPLG